MRPGHVSGSEVGGRREVAEERPHSPSPSLSGSYGFEGEEYYDSEEEARGRESDRGSATERSVQGPAPASTSSGAQPPKPKRTRQLTTPHQSAVLHALLAQSRFPTTQMREEVGRQIGLSARKVQVWFQNQRQKARKESREAAAVAAAGGSAAVRPIPPQFGPFTNVPPAGPSASSAFLGEGPSSSRIQQRQGRIGEPSMSITHERVAGPAFARLGHESESHTHASAPSRRASEPTLDIYSASSIAALRRPSRVDLTGPGVPGSGGTDDPLSQRRDSALPSMSSARYSQPLSPEQPPRLPPVHTIGSSLSPSRRHEAQTQSPYPAYRPERLDRESPPQSLRLPPIQIMPSDQHHEAFATSHTYSTSLGRSSTARPPPPRPPISSPAPPAGRGIPSSTSATPPPIPPPFTLEPSPLWQTPLVISSRARTHSVPMSHTTPSAGPSSQFLGANETLMEGRSRTLPHPTRTTRFDPVRNTEIVPIQPHGRTRSRSPGEEN